MSKIALTEEQKKELIYELALAVNGNKRYEERSSAKAQMADLVKCIIIDKKFAVWNTQILTQILKKTPIWPKLQKVIKNENSCCGTKRCGHSEYSHNKGSGCTYKIWKWSNTTNSGNTTPCLCKKFIQRPL